MAHTDRHVVKMTLECAQILCSAHWLCDKEIGEGWYQPTHLYHPVVQWTAEKSIHYRIVYQQFKLLALEYTYRYGREHKSWYKLGGQLEELPINIPQEDLADSFVMAMPRQYRPDLTDRASLSVAVAAYRRYYRGEKQGLFKWTNRKPPLWLLS